MKRFLTVALLAATIALLPGLARAEVADPPAAHRVVTICNFNWRTVAGVKSIIRCSVQKYPVSGGVGKAFYIADRESHFHYWARNSSSGACGVYQHMPRYWPERWRTYGNGTVNDCYNGRSNVIVSIRMAHRGGWGPWGG